MKLSKLLENFDIDFDSESVSTSNGALDELSFSDLTPQQVGILLRMSSGDLSYDLASDTEMDMMDELRDIGLLDDEWELSREGQAAARLASETGGSHDLQKSRERASMGDIDLDIDQNIDLGNGDEFQDDEEFKFQ
jgi:hypothetical protein